LEKWEKVGIAMSPENRQRKMFSERHQISSDHIQGFVKFSDLRCVCPVFTKKSKMRIRLRIKLINSHYLLKISLNLLKFVLLIQEVRIDILVLLKHGYLIKYLNY